MKKDNSTLILLVLAGLGIYWYFKNKKAPVTVVTPTGTAATDTSMVAAPTQDSDYNVKFSINGMKKLGNVPNTI